MLALSRRCGGTCSTDSRLVYPPLLLQLLHRSVPPPSCTGPLPVAPPAAATAGSVPLSPAAPPSPRLLPSVLLPSPAALAAAALAWRLAAASAWQAAQAWWRSEGRTRAHFSSARNTWQAFGVEWRLERRAGCGLGSGIAWAVHTQSTIRHPPRLAFECLNYKIGEHSKAPDNRAAQLRTCQASPLLAARVPDCLPNTPYVATTPAQPRPKVQGHHASAGTTPAHLPSPLLVARVAGRLPQDVKALHALGPQQVVGILRRRGVSGALVQSEQLAHGQKSQRPAHTSRSRLWASCSGGE